MYLEILLNRSRIQNSTSLLSTEVIVEVKTFTDTLLFQTSTPDQFGFKDQICDFVMFCIGKHVWTHLIFSDELVYSMKDMTVDLYFRFSKFKSKSNFPDN